MFVLDRSKNDTSVSLDLLRAVSAQMVCVGHAISFFAADRLSPALPLMQNVGVLIFFLISGFLITHTLVRKSERADYGFVQFCIDRFSRIYSGLIPALILIAIVDGIALWWVNDPNVARYYTFKTMLANLVMLEGYLGAFNALEWSPFGSASPLWTLGVEWQIYIFVSGLYFFARNPRARLPLLPLILFFGQTPIFLILGSVQSNGLGRGLFVLWCAGALICFADRMPIARLIPGLTIGISGLIAFIAFTRPHKEYNFVPYALVTAAFFGLVAVTQINRVIRSPHAIKAIGFAADYSFSLYLIHYTIMYSMWSISPSRGLLVAALAVVASNLIAIVLAEIGEKQHRKLAEWLHRALQNRRRLVSRKSDSSVQPVGPTPDQHPNGCMGRRLAAEPQNPIAIDDRPRQER